MFVHSVCISCTTALLLSASGDELELASDPCGVVDAREAADRADARLEVERECAESTEEDATLAARGALLARLSLSHAAARSELLRERRPFLPPGVAGSSASSEWIDFKCMRDLLVSSIFFMILNSSCVMCSYSYIRSMFESLARGLLLRKKRFLNILSSESIALSISDPLMKLLSHTTLTVYIVDVVIQAITFFFIGVMALKLEQDADPSSDWVLPSQTSSDEESDSGDSTSEDEEKEAKDKYSIYERRVATMVAKRDTYIRNKINSGTESDGDNTPPKKPGKGKGKARQQGGPSNPSRKRARKEDEDKYPRGFLFG